MRVTGMMQNLQLLKNVRNINTAMMTGQQQLATGQKSANRAMIRSEPVIKCDTIPTWRGARSF